MYNMFYSQGSNFYKDSGLLEHKAESVGEWLLTFRKNLLPSTSKVKMPMKVPHSSETGTNQPLT